MSKFINKTATISIKVNENTLEMKCKECKGLNYIAGSPYAMGSHIYKVMIRTLESMNENNCKEIKINASWV